MASPLPPAPSSNPHAGYHPSSFGPDVPFTAAALGASSSNGSASLGMSISPPHWVAGNTLAGTPGSFGGSLGAMGTSFGRERDRELEAKYVKDFQCCGKELDGLHELLEQLVLNPRITADGQLRRVSCQPGPRYTNGCHCCRQVWFLPFGDAFSTADTAKCLDRRRFLSRHSAAHFGRELSASTPRRCTDSSWHDGHRDGGFQIRHFRFLSYASAKPCAFVRVQNVVSAESLGDSFPTFRLKYTSTGCHS